jgi:membrane-bound acyltransferase YfiQ involved in biofilm formation
MSQPYKRKHKTGIPDFRAFLDYFMGGLMIFGGIFIIFSKYMLGYDYFEDSDFVKGGMQWFLGFVFAIYGAFRLYRGIQIQKQKKWEKENQQDV